MKRTEENTQENDDPLADIFDLFILEQSRDVDFAAPFGPFYLAGSWQPTGTLTGTLTSSLTSTPTDTSTSHQKTAADSVLHLPFDDSRAAACPTRALIIYRFSANTVIYLYFGDPLTTDCKENRREICRMSNEMFDAHARAYVDAAYTIYERIRREWDTQPEWGDQPELNTQPELHTQ